MEHTQEIMSVPMTSDEAEHQLQSGTSVIDTQMKNSFGSLKSIVMLSVSATPFIR